MLAIMMIMNIVVAAKPLYKVDELPGRAYGLFCPILF